MKSVKTKFIAFRIDPWTHSQLIEASRELGIDLSELVRRLVRLYVMCRNASEVGLSLEELVLFVKASDNII